MEGSVILLPNFYINWEIQNGYKLRRKKFDEMG